MTDEAKAFEENTFGEQIAVWRASAGMERCHLAAQLCDRNRITSEQDIYRWETDRVKKFDRATTQLLADILTEGNLDRLMKELPKPAEAPSSQEGQS